MFYLFVFYVDWKWIYIEIFDVCCFGVLLLNVFDSEFEKKIFWIFFIVKYYLNDEIVVYVLCI